MSGSQDAFRWLNWAFSARISGSRHHVLLVLAKHAGDGGTCWPSIEAIAEIAGIVRRTVQSCLADLERDGFISVQRRGDTSSIYTLQHAVVQPIQPRAKSAHRRQRSAEFAHQGGAEFAHQGGAEFAPKLLKEEELPKIEELPKVQAQTPADLFGEVVEVAKVGKPKKAKPPLSQVSIAIVNQRKRLAKLPKVSMSDEDLDHAFDEFWGMFPNHSDPFPARLAFKAAVAEGASTADVILGVGKYQFHPNYPHKAHNWLKDRLWIQDSSPAAPVAAKPTRRSFLMDVTNDLQPNLGAGVSHPNVIDGFAEGVTIR